MKIYVLLALIALIVGLSHYPIRRQPKTDTAAPPDSVPA
jgi:hypothetical protein